MCLSYYIFVTSTVNIFDYNGNGNNKLLSAEYYTNIKEKTHLRKFIDFISINIFFCSIICSSHMQSYFANKEGYYLYTINFFAYGFLFMWTIYDDIVISVLSCNNVVFENDGYEKI
jgi:hypothetical protein